MLRYFFSFVLLGSAVVHAKDTTIPTIGFTSTSNLSERAVTIEANAERLVVIEKTADGVAEVEIRLRADSVVVTRKSELQDSRNDIHLPAIAAWAKANPADAASVQQHFDWLYSQYTGVAAPNSSIEAGGCGAQLQDLIDAADAMALACGGYTGGTVACANATTAYRRAKEALLRCVVQQYQRFARTLLRMPG